MHKKNKFWHNQYTIPILVAFLIPSFVWGVTTIGTDIDTEGVYKQDGSSVLDATSNSSLILGLSSGTTSTDAIGNTILGNSGGTMMTTGDYNVGIGLSALNKLTTGLYNVSISGIGALEENTTGGYNIGIGLYAGRKNTTGERNLAIGYQTLQYNDGGSGNVAVGDYALWGASGQSYSNNVALGIYSGRYTQGSNNVYIGTRAGNNVTTGSNNTMLGYQAGDNLTTGSNNIIIGYDIDATSTTMIRGLNIGNLIFATGLDGTGTTISSGSVGIGEINPTELLTIKVPAATDSGLFITEGSGNGGVVEYSEAGNYLFVGGRASGSNSSEGIYLPRGGKVGINTSSPESVLQVTGGGLCVGSDANCNSDNNTEGTVYAATTAMTTYDLAENYPTKDHTLVAGDVVALDTTQDGPYVKRAESGDVIMGAISAEPGALLGGFNGAQYAHEKQVPVALSGRIDVKVSTENGNIKSGDYLELSSTPGVAAKATGKGKVIGIALESYSGEGVGEVLVFVELNSAEEKIANQQQQIDLLQYQLQKLEALMQALLQN